MYWLKINKNSEQKILLIKFYNNITIINFLFNIYLYLFFRLTFTIH